MFTSIITLMMIFYSLDASDDEHIQYGKIVGGISADIMDYPYQISLQLNGSHICGGAIISPTWALTAAHCVPGFTSSNLSIRAGSSRKNSGGEIISIQEVLKHERYRPRTTDYDIALLRLSSEVTHPNAKTVPLAGPGNGPATGSNVTITGWGRLREGGPSSNQLQVVQVPVVSPVLCQIMYAKLSITDRMFCAGVLFVGGRDSCNEDSGGPAVIDGELTGIVSWGVGCARPRFPGVYTNIPVLRRWIYDKSGI